jgi:hypothetical protein
MIRTAAPARLSRPRSPATASPTSRRDTAPRQAAADPARTTAGLLPDVSRVPVQPATARAAARPTPIQRGAHASSRVRTQISARIRRPVQAGHDAPPGADVPDLGAQAAQVSNDPAPLTMPEPAAGQTVSVPDIVPGGRYEMADSVSSTLDYQPVITNSGAVSAGSFGTTGFDDPTLNGILIANNAGSYAVTATLIQGIHWQVVAAGPQGQADIESITDPAITRANFAQVAGDLTPNVSDFGGRPPRLHFWSRDLTVLHEMFHANEIAQHGNEGAGVAKNFLNHSAAGSLADVWGLLHQVPGQVVHTIIAAMPHHDAETRAYTAGAVNYSVRASAIRIIGSAGGYP